MKKKLIPALMLTATLLFGGTSYAAAYDQYTVKDNETFWTIAAKTGVDVSTLIAINPLVDSGNLYHGLIISLPWGHKPMSGITPASQVTRKTYTVEGNDTFWSIAQKTGLPLPSLIAANPKVKDPSNIYAGMVLNVPTAPKPSAQSANWETKADGIIALAKDQLGVPYVWGGETPWVALDCSGLTKYVFGKYGIDLPHQALVQYQYGTPVAADELRKGDLVFFKEHGSATITHVGIYIGNDQMIDADTDPKDGVQITNVFGDAYYNSCYAGAKRLL